LRSQKPHFYDVKEQLRFTLAEILDFGPMRFCQVGKERRFLGVFMPQVGVAIHFIP
jgi:hypothetical protein